MADTDLTRPIAGIENRTAQEVFDIMCDRFRRAPSPSPAPGVVEAAKAVLANWDERLANGAEVYKTSADLDFSYWSPSASMVASEHMAALRAALASLSQPAKGEREGEQPKIAVLPNGTGVCIGGRWSGWQFRKHPNGGWVSEMPLEMVDPMEGSPLASFFQPEKGGK